MLCFILAVVVPLGMGCKMSIEQSGDVWLPVFSWSLDTGVRWRVKLSLSVVPPFTLALC